MYVRSFNKPQLATVVFGCSVTLAVNEVAALFYFIEVVVAAGHILLPVYFKLYS